MTLKVPNCSRRSILSSWLALSHSTSSTNSEKKKPNLSPRDASCTSTALKNRLTKTSCARFIWNKRLYSTICVKKSLQRSTCQRKYSWSHSNSTWPMLKPENRSAKQFRLDICLKRLLRRNLILPSLCNFRSRQSNLSKAPWRGQRLWAPSKLETKVTRDSALRLKVARQTSKLIHKDRLKRWFRT